MLIIGAGGFAKELLEVNPACHPNQDLARCDDVCIDMPGLLFGLISIKKGSERAILFFANNGFVLTLGICNLYKRYKMERKFSFLSEILTSVISQFSIFGRYDFVADTGVNILHNPTISNSVIIVKDFLVYYTVSITHYSILNNFGKISSWATLLGGCQISRIVQIVASATISIIIKIGRNIIIGAEAVVNKNIPYISVAVGVSALVIKYNL